MVERLEVKVLCGARRRQPRVEGNCTRQPLDECTTVVFAVRTCGMEAGCEPQHRTQVNLYAGFPDLGERARKRDAQYPSVAVGVLEAGAAGHFSTLPQEISIDPRLIGKARGGNDECLRSMEKSDHPKVAWKPGNAGGAKGVTS